LSYEDKTSSADSKSDRESQNTSSRTLSWEELGLSGELLQLVAKAGYAEPTPIQQRTIPLGLGGKDIIASARTGSGKTAAFCFPMFEKLKGRKGTYGLILCPTREIALQTQQTIELFGNPLGIVSVSLIGGTDIKADKAALNGHPQIIVGTPGRICDHIDRGNLWLEFIEILVLDEADRMLDMGFAKELSRIVNEIPNSRQTMLFSATFSSTIEQLARKILYRPERIAIGSSRAVPKTVEQELLWVNEANKRRELIRILRRETGTMIIFTKTKDGASRLFRTIHAAGIVESTYISSNKSQTYREEALQGFKEGKYRVIVATDVAARGIHVENVGFVINYDLPMEPEDYIHRIGRTGRQDARGKAITFVTPDDVRTLERIEKLIGQRIPERFVPDYIPEKERKPRRHSSKPGGGSGKPRKRFGSSSSGGGGRRRPR
jgi:ATP-dependent RNA helicase RhlE